jgi:type II secretory pathway component PulJ
VTTETDQQLFRKLEALHRAICILNADIRSCDQSAEKAQGETRRELVALWHTRLADRSAMLVQLDERWAALRDKAFRLYSAPRETPK